MGKRIVVAEDQTPQRERLGFILKKEGYGVFEAENGVIALEHIQREGLDLLVTDIGMPEMDGLTLITLLGERGYNVPVIVCSGLLFDPCCVRYYS